MPGPVQQLDSRVRNCNQSYYSSVTSYHHGLLACLGRPLAWDRPHTQAASERDGGGGGGGGEMKVCVRVRERMCVWCDGRGRGRGVNAQSTMAVISGRGERERGLCVFSPSFFLKTFAISTPFPFSCGNPQFRPSNVH